MNEGRRRPGLRHLVPVAAFALSLALPALSTAQTRYVRLEGRVQWIAGTMLSLSVPDSPGVAIDLDQVPQGDYFGLTQGEWITVTGQVVSGSTRVVGVSIQRDPGTQAP